MCVYNSHCLLVDMLYSPPQNGVAKFTTPYSFRSKIRFGDFVLTDIYFQSTIIYCDSAMGSLNRKKRFRFLEKKTRFPLRRPPSSPSLANQWLQCSITPGVRRKQGINLRKRTFMARSVGHSGCGVWTMAYGVATLPTSIRGPPASDLDMKLKAQYSTQIFHRLLLLLCCHFILRSHGDPFF
jgi:hypothetical protein